MQKKIKRKTLTNLKASKLNVVYTISKYMYLYTSQKNINAPGFDSNQIFFLAVRKKNDYCLHPLRQSFLLK